MSYNDSLLERQSSTTGRGRTGSESYVEGDGSTRLETTHASSAPLPAGECCRASLGRSCSFEIYQENQLAGLPDPDHRLSYQGRCQFMRGWALSSLQRSVQ